MIYILILIYLLNLLYIKKKKLFKSSYIMHFFFISIIFIGPAIYYELGFTSYAKSFEWEDVITFEKYGFFVFFCTLIFSYFLAHSKKTIFNSFFKNYSDRNKNLVFIYYLFWYFLVGFYILFYISELPIIKFIQTGSLPERFDQSDSVKLFYTFSSFFMVFIPSGYFFFVRYLKNNLSKFILLLTVAFILTSGGHKGLVAFFVIFSLLFSGIKFNFKYILVSFIALSGLLVVYTLTKGKEFNKETFMYLLESPPRRFFVTQGSGFITRISMERKNLYKGDIYEYKVIKQETYEKIYPNTKSIGAAPTIFLGDIHVRYGYVATLTAYIIFLIFIFPIVKGTDNMPQRKLYLWWNLFMLFFLLGMAEISYSSSLRILLVLFNFIVVLIIPFLKLRKH